MNHKTKKNDKLDFIKTTSKMTRPTTDLVKAFKTQVSKELYPEYLKNFYNSMLKWTTK